MADSSPLGDGSFNVNSGSDEDSSSSDDDNTLPIHLQVENYAFSTGFLAREKASQTIEIWFKTATAESIEHDLPKLMETIHMLVENSGCKVEWLEQMPDIASQAVLCADRAPILNGVIVDYILPIVLRNLGTSSNIVNKTAQEALLELMRRKLIPLPHLEIRVCPSVLALSQDMENVACANPSVITLMSKMVRYMGTDVTERVFLKRFTELCSSHLFYVRRVCASYFGDFAIAVRRNTFESTLLPCYLDLCKDSISGVRGSCAQVAMYVSHMCSPKIRKTVLTPVFADLLQDECRWVRLSAFNAIGAFISTFADPSIIKLEYSERGELIFSTGDGIEYRNASIRNIENILETSPSPCQMFVPSSKKEDFSITKNFFWDLDDATILKMTESSDQQDCLASLLLAVDNNKDSNDSGRCTLTPDITDDVENMMKDVFISENQDNTSNTSIEASSTKDANLNECSLDSTICEKTSSVDASENVNEIENNNVHVEQEDTLHLYNSYNYWYISPELPIEADHTSSNAAKESGNKSPCSNKEKGDAEKACEDVGYSGAGDDKRDEEEEDDSQYTVPKVLVGHFISMTEPNLIYNFHHEMTYQCAYSLPAVALTLGGKNWHFLKDTVEKLAADRQYKVRRTVAGYLHELAHIVGPDIASTDLIPLFEGFVKDLDEVRIEVLKNLNEFLHSVNPSKLSIFLPRLPDFLKIDHQWNWRFRNELAVQLTSAVPLFRPIEVTKHIAPIAQELLCDNAAEVRHSALLLMTQILKYTSAETIMNSRLLAKLTEMFAHSMKWKRRQIFALLCCELLATDALKPERFACEVMPVLLDMSWDSVVNVRLVVARAVAKHILSKDYFVDPNNQYRDSLEIVLQRLQTDKDKDVRQEAEVNRC